MRQTRILHEIGVGNVDGFPFPIVGRVGHHLGLPCLGIWVVDLGDLLFAVGFFVSFFELLGFRIWDRLWDLIIVLGLLVGLIHDMLFFRLICWPLIVRIGDRPGRIDIPMFLQRDMLRPWSPYQSTKNISGLGEQSKGRDEFWYPWVPRTPLFCQIVLPSMMENYMDPVLGSTNIRSKHDRVLAITVESLGIKSLRE